RGGTRAQRASSDQSSSSSSLSSHSPSMHSSSASQRWSQPPQCSTSSRFVQVSPQRATKPVQASSRHSAAPHGPSQAFPQPPQCRGSPEGSMQTSSQRRKPERQAHAPASHHSRASSQSGVQSSR